MRRAAVVAFALVIAACGGDDAEVGGDTVAPTATSEATTTTTIAPTTTVATTTTVPDTTTSLLEVSEDLEFGEVTVSGVPLPRFDAAVTDASVGAPIPAVVGSDFEGTEVGIVDDGTAKVIVFLAHWCPHCQAEVPSVRDWLGGYDLPEGVAFYSVATGMDPSRPNYPSSQWLEGEMWPVPVIVDDDAFAAARAFGLNAYPFWVFVYGDGTLAARVAGGLPIEVLTNAVELLAEGPPTV